MFDWIPGRLAHIHADKNPREVVDLIDLAEIELMGARILRTWTIGLRSPREEVVLSALIGIRNAVAEQVAIKLDRLIRENPRFAEHFDSGDLEAIDWILELRQDQINRTRSVNARVRRVRNKHSITIMTSTLPQARRVTSAA